MAVRSVKNTIQSSKESRYGEKSLTSSMHWFEGPQGLLEEHLKGTFEGDGYSLTWYGGETLLQALTRGAEGTMEYVPAVERMLDRVNSQMAVETQGYTFNNAVAGIFPDVPAAIAGFPESMFQLEDNQNDHAPITVWINLTMSGGFDADAIARRGAGVAALVMKLQALRPVMLNVMVGLGSHYVVCPIHARPLSIAQVSYLMCSAGWTRQVYNYLTQCQRSGGGWDNVFIHHSNKANSPGFHEDMLRMVGGDVEHDIFVPPLYLYDELANNPAEWVAQRMAKYYKQEGI